jgi:membrane fusion protein (multidrug efflux system)
VPEQAIALVKVGQTLDVNVISFPDRPFPATVRFISPALRASTRDLIIEASAKNADNLLRPGMFATVSLVVGEEDQPTVPVDAIKEDGTIKRMFLAKNGSAYEMIVRTGVTRDGRIAIFEPLTAGQPVIVKPPPGLRDGSTIQ